MLKNNKKKKTNFSNIVILFGILVLIFYIAVILYYYQQFLFFPEKTEKYNINKLIERINILEQEESEELAVNGNFKDLKTNISTNQAKGLIEDSANKIINYLENNMFTELSNYVHPQKGVRFSPYAYVREDDIVFTAEHLKSFHDKEFWSNNIKYPWGNYDGSGEPIELTFSEYFYDFIYDKYYSRADYILYNQTIVLGNSINNAANFYNNPIIVEYYFEPINPKYGGMDWSALRLVFEKFEGQWYLVGIIHDEWTI